MSGSPTVLLPFDGGVSRDGTQVRSAENKTIESVSRGGGGFRRGRDCDGTFWTRRRRWRARGNDCLSCLTVSATHARFTSYTFKKICIRFIECVPSLSTPTRMPLHGVFKAALNGMHERGDGGFVYIKGDECVYLFPSELKGHAEAKESLEEMLADEKAKMVFYVLEERDNALHVLAYERKRVLKDMIEEKQWTPPAPAPPAIEEVDT